MPIDDNKNTMNINDTVQVIKDATIQILEAMEKHTRITISDLKDKVIATTHLPTSIVAGVIYMILKEDTGGTIESGRNGGYWRGGRTTRTDNRPRCNECKQVLRKINPKD